MLPVALLYFVVEFSLKLCNISTSLSLVIQLSEQVDQCELEGKKMERKGIERVFNFTHPNMSQAPQGLLKEVSP